MKKIYIAGKITGLPMEEVWNKFHNAERELIRKHDALCIITNPLRVQGINSLEDYIEHEKNPKTWQHYLKTSLIAMFECEIIALLPCHKESKGALLELHNAENLNMEIIYL